MRRVLLEINDKNFLSPLQQAQQSSSSSLNLDSSGYYLNIKISPMILLLILVFSIVFCTYGFLHLLVRSLWRPRNRDIGRLQQLFNLHDSEVDQSFIDSGVDQSVIDALPVFNYKSIIGLKDPFDCAVCLCEFEDEDELRLLAKCSHAFHTDCIDTWLLSHSTCPLCRDSLLHDFPPSRNCSPQVFVLESRSSETSREIVLARESNHSGNCNNEIGSRVTSQSSDEFLKMPFSRFLDKEETEIQPPPPPTPEVIAPSVKKFVPVKLGKYRNVDSVGEGSSTNNIVSRRCLSMGSFAYVMDENAPLQVPIKPTAKKHSIKKHNMPLSPLHRAAMSECGFDSRRVLEESSSDINGIQETKTGRFSDSKIYLRGKINRNNSAKLESERGGSSFLFPLQISVVAEDGMKNKSGNGERKAVSESEFDRRKHNEVSEYDCDDEVQSCNSMDSEAAHTPFARTLHWLIGRTNNVLHSHPSSNVSSHNHFNFI